MSGTPPPAFRVRDCALITLALGRSARGLRELRNAVAEVPAASLSHHFCETLLRPAFDDPEYGNDFSTWASRHLRDPRLAERLALIDPPGVGGSEALRSRLLEVLDARLAETAVAPTVPPEGEGFHFLRSQIVVFETGIEAAAPEDLGARLPRLSLGSVFLHFVDARRRSPLGADDFTAWVERWGPSEEPLRRRIAEVDPSYGSLAEIRERLARAFALAGGAR